MKKLFSILLFFLSFNYITVVHPKGIKLAAAISLIGIAIISFVFWNLKQQK